MRCARLTPEPAAGHHHRRLVTSNQTAKPLNQRTPNSHPPLRRTKLGPNSRYSRVPLAVRYQRERPGELVHLDTKNLGRIEGIGHRITGRRPGAINRHHGIGWEALHVATDDASRLAYTELVPDEKKESALAFLGRALDWFARHGVTVERIMTDAPPIEAMTSASASCRQPRTRPYTPRTNGKAERFIQTSLREWAYVRPYQSSAERGSAMHPWIANYNHARPHSALGGKPPAAKLNNVLGFNS